jgi:hypothetical protein
MDKNIVEHSGGFGFAFNSTRGWKTFPKISCKGTIDVLFRSQSYKTNVLFFKIYQCHYKIKSGDNEPQLKRTKMTGPELFVIIEFECIIFMFA